MRRRMKEGALVALLCLALPVVAAAQERGRTDGPEGSEYGKGGYQRAGGGRVGLMAEFGGVWTPSGPLSGTSRGPPLAVGLTGIWWADEQVFLEASGTYVADSGRVNVLVGPRVRTGTQPFSLSAALKAGPIIVPQAGLHFGLSPQLGADMLINNRVLLGLNYALDVAVGAGLSHRLFMGLGYRF